MLRDLYSTCDQKRIPLAASISRRRGNRLRYFEFIPSIFRDDFVETIFDISDRYPDLDIVLTHDSEFNGADFDWI
jgi:hypothetical protein